MDTRSKILGVLLAATLMLPLAGCGENDNNVNFNDNGSGKPSATPARTATAGPTPAATATPVPSNEPTEVAATPTDVSATATGGPESPTVTPTPTGAVCSAGEHVMVDVSLDEAFAAFAITLAYPTDAVNIPGTGQDAAVKQRVQFIVSGGLSTSSDDDDMGGDGVDDTLHASFVSNVDNAAGKVLTVTFDCTAGQPMPGVGAFACTVVSASNSQADTITPGCALQVR